MNKIDNILKIQLLLKKLINELIYFLLTIKLKINNELSELKRGMGISKINCIDHRKLRKSADFDI